MRLLQAGQRRRLLRQLGRQRGGRPRLHAVVRLALAQLLAHGVERSLVLGARKRDLALRIGLHARVHECDGRQHLDGQAGAGGGRRVPVLGLSALQQGADGALAAGVAQRRAHGVDGGVGAAGTAPCWPPPPPTTLAAPNAPASTTTCRGPACWRPTSRR